ncbi:SpaH/EbpB family LPXTG-anchored major pilin [Enterococcus avium]|uniref:SpaH/EbpB family LPXTG-anchored major pilin n=2 Tax=Enterococcus avium TaxID=33945 RepID=UPI00289231D5|nr:SpaH/EbpB family LPXTG-anchored major pilin [Enterococcus avium]MDT2470202.1 SpaH/EbpB family LPXTG-anchored major pilin [Enterococcus avium]
MKKMILLLGLILGICNMGVTAFAEESLVEVLIKTRPETGNVYTGIEQIDMDVYDLTEWRQKRASNEKADKEYIMDTYPTKERLAIFVQTEQLKKINQAPYSVDAKGEISLSLPRQQNNQDAAYLILSSGETGNYHMVPIIIYLPQRMTNTLTEADKLEITCKYREIPVTPPTSEPPPSTTTTTTTKSTEPPITDSSGPRKDLPKTIGTPSGGERPSYSGKELPSTNELIRNYCFLGLLLMIVGLVGLNKNKGKKIMKNKKKWVALLTTLLCLIPLLAGVLGGGDSAYAADSVDVTIHKKKMDEFPNSSIENTGEEMNEFNRYEGLPGITFTAWDISEDFYAELRSRLTGNETDAEYNTIAKEVMNDFELNNAPNATRVGTDQTTDQDGNANFTNLPTKNADGTYKVYFFEEHASQGVEIGSYKLIMMLPMKGSNGQDLTKIHLYPKNKVEGEDPVKELVDDNGDPLPPRPAGAYDFEVGQQIHYRASFVIPSQIGDLVNGAPRYTKLEFKDAVDQTGVKFEGIDQIVIGGTAVTPATFLANATADYYNTAAPFTGYAGFNIAMNLTGAAGPATAQYLSQYAGQRIEFYYTVSFTDETPVDLDINNEFTVTMNHDGGQDDVKTNDPIDPIITGGKKFFKHEDGETKGLAGAEFVVIREVNGVEQYLIVGTDSKTWTPVGPNEDYANATKFISDADGRFEVTGLAYGDYMLREIKAPNGFQKLTDDVDFEIDKDSYNNATALPIANSSKGGTLPSTGGMGIIAFIVIGLGLMAAAIVRYRRVRFEV